MREADRSLDEVVDAVASYYGLSAEDVVSGAISLNLSGRMRCEASGASCDPKFTVVDRPTLQRSAQQQRIARLANC